MDVGRISKQSIDAVYDFTRCQRPDGSTYGTGGRCRKGTQIDAEQPNLLSRVRSLARGAVKKVTGSERRERKALERKVEEEKREARKAEAVRRKANTEDMVGRVKKDAPAGTTVKDTGGSLMLSRTTKSGHKIDYLLARNGNVEFTVNGSWNVGSVKDRKEQVEVALSVRRMHEAVVKNLKPGHTIWTNAWVEDGKGESREKAYEAMGFSKAQGYDNTMVGRKTESGKIRPASGKADSSSLFDDQDFSEREVREVKLWLAAIFGQDI